MKPGEFVKLALVELSSFLKDGDMVTFELQLDKDCEINYYGAARVTFTIAVSGKD